MVDPWVVPGRVPGGFGRQERSARACAQAQGRRLKRVCRQLSARAGLGEHAHTRFRRGGPLPAHLRALTRRSRQSAAHRGQPGSPRSALAPDLFHSHPPGIHHRQGKPGQAHLHVGTRGSKLTQARVPACCPLEGWGVSAPPLQLCTPQPPMSPEGTWLILGLFRGGFRQDLAARNGRRARVRRRREED